VKSAQAHDVPYEELNSAEVRKRYPRFKPRDGLTGSSSRGGVLVPEDSIGAMLAQAATRRGAPLRRAGGFVGA
jgi:hypothetical protein